jgi:hypothetical protein
MLKLRSAVVLSIFVISFVTLEAVSCTESCFAQQTFATGYPDVRQPVRQPLRQPILAGNPLLGRNSARQPQAETTNFVVYAPDEFFARQVAQEAESYRRELAIKWLGYALPDWSEKCPIRVEIQPHAGGETSFAFMTQGGPTGIPTAWDMKIFGPPDRLLDAVLPHEITHTIFATHFQRPLPRWADEGACTTVEHESEKRKNHSLLMNFLSASPSRGIPFNRMFTMRNYPRDILPLYAQGFSVAKYLIMQKGRRHFLDYIAAGMNRETPGRETTAWDQTTEQFYGYKDLSELQVSWIKWVKNGSIEKPIPGNEPKSDRLPDGNELNDRFASIPQAAEERQTAVARQVSFVRNDDEVLTMNKGWYAKQMKVGAENKTAAANELSFPDPGPIDKMSTYRESLPPQPPGNGTIYR